MEEFNLNGLGLRDQALLAAVRLTGGNLNKTFTAEDLLVEAWKYDHAAWGLRRFEERFPDAEKINKELNRRGTIGLVGQGYIERTDRMVYRLTVAGLHEATKLRPADPVTRERANRELESSVKQILEHPAFKSWLSDPAKPKFFREAGHFWGIAAGTPPKTVRDRLQRIERVLRDAQQVLEEKKIERIAEQGGRLLYDRNDIDRCLEFQQVLKSRFSRDLAILAPDLTLVNALKE